MHMWSTTANNFGLVRIHFAVSFTTLGAHFCMFIRVIFCAAAHGLVRGLLNGTKHLS